MNNKKLFKGALVLFASILMAVSCQSNSKPGDDNTTQQPGGDDKETPVSVTIPADAKDKTKTTIVIKGAKNAANISNLTAGEVTLEGEDASKATVKIKSVTGLTEDPKWTKQSSTGIHTGGWITAGANIDNKTKTITISKSEAKVSFNVNEGLKEALYNSSSFFASKSYIMAEVVLTISLEGKTSKEETVYVVIGSTD